MATKEFSFEGKLKWAKVQRVNDFGKFTVDFYPKDDATRKAVKATGVKINIKEDEKDGDGFFYTFRLNPEGKFAPKSVAVVGVDGVPFTGLVGNGSEGLVTIQVYDYSNSFGTGVGHHLVKVELTKLVVYKRPEEDTGTEKRHPLPVA